MNSSTESFSVGFNLISLRSENIRGIGGRLSTPGQLRADESCALNSFMTSGADANNFPAIPSASGWDPPL